MFRADKSVFEENEVNEKISADSVDVLQADNLRNSIDEEAFEPDLNEQFKNCISIALVKFWTFCDRWVSIHAKLIKVLFMIMVFCGLVLYIAAAARQFYISGQKSIDWCHGYGMVIILLAISVWTLFYYCLVVPFLFPHIFMCLQNNIGVAVWNKASYVVYFALALLVGGFLVWDSESDRRRLISVGGLFTFIVSGFIFSKHPTRVKWKTVLMGLLIQFIIGLLAIRWRGGRQVLTCVGNLTETFLEHSYTGAQVVYSKYLVDEQKVLAFQALTAIFFVSMIVQILFYLGWMQVFCLKLGWLMQVTLGTTVMESVNAVASVFIGMAEAPLLYKPYIVDLTPSEIHAVMAGGFSTVAGNVFAAYTSFGVNPAHIITASIMTAPAALCFAKLVYPEDRRSKTDVRVVKLYKSEDKSLMDAAIQGAMQGTMLVLGIIASIVAFVSIVEFLNSVLKWLGILVGVHDFTLESILAHLLYPIVWLMGVEPSHCYDVSTLIGIKISTNEFAAYKKFGEKYKDKFSARTEAITTYALCSFANPGSIGILISTLTTLCPAQRFNIITVAARAFCASIIISFLTACIAGALMPEMGFTD